MRAISATLFAFAAAILTHQAGLPARLRAWVPRSPIAGRRRRSLIAATGIVGGTERELRRLVRLRTGLVAFSSLVGVAVVSVRTDAIGFAAAGASMVLGWQVPAWRARRRERERLEHIEIEMVDALGEMVMCVESGLSLESAMSVYADRHHNPLAEEFRGVLDRIAVGSSRDSSLQELLDRSPTSGMQLFVAAIRQNQRLGAPLASVLRQQASTARRRRRQAIEERSAKLSMKMVFPTVFCVLPALMIVVVGPALIRTIQSLS